MFLIVRSLFLISFLVSCGTTPESRYRDTEALERPPTVASSRPTKEQRVVDTSSIPKRKDRTGLGSDVYQSTRTQLTIKQSFDKAWNTVGRALKQSDIKITDHERDKGLYYVTRDTDENQSAGFFSFLNDDSTVYLLTVKQEDDETTVTATVANASEQNATVGKDGAPKSAAEGAEDLMQLLLITLRDKLEEE
jgi:uncharacterized lipoprotein